MIALVRSNIVPGHIWSVGLSLKHVIPPASLGLPCDNLVYKNSAPNRMDPLSMRFAPFSTSAIPLSLKQFSCIAQLLES